MIKIYYSGVKNCGVSYYRGIMPLSMIKEVTLKIESNPNPVWSDIADQDIIFITRPMSWHSLNIIKLAKKMNKKIVVDFDDLFHTVPMSSPFWFYSKQNKCDEFFKECITFADVLTCSTNLLKEEATRHYNINSENVRIIKNAHNDYIFPIDKIKFSNFNKVIFWRGNATHWEDVQFRIRNINEAIDKNPDFTFMFKGFIPHNIYLRQNVKFDSETDIFSYLEQLKGLAPSIIIKPLAPNVFNKAKSDITALEGLYAGAICLSEKNTEWEDSASNLVDLQLWVDKVRSKDKTVQEAFDKYKDNLTTKRLLSETNKQRLEIFKNLLA